MTLRSRSRLSHTYGWDVRPSWGGSRVEATLLVSDPVFELTWGPNDDLKLQGKLLDKIKSHDFDLGKFAAEGNQVVNLASSTLLKLGRAARSVRRGDFATAARQLGRTPRRGLTDHNRMLDIRDVPAKWLELQYGWLPLLSDVHSAAEAFEEISNGPRSAYFHVSSRKRAKTVKRSNWLIEYDQEEEYIKSIGVRLYEEMSFARQLGLLDPLSVAWEVTPWSFVVDWFIPIGSYLTVLNQLPSVNAQYRTTTLRRVSGFWNARYTGSGPLGGYDPPVGLTYPDSDDAYLVEVNRSISSELPVPLPRFKGQDAIHGNRVWNAIALASQMFLGPLPKARK